MATRLAPAGLLLATAIAGCAPEPASPPPPPPAPIARDASQAAFERAWELLEVDRKPAEAAAALRGVVDAAGAPPALRTRALVLLARCERLLGRREESERLLRTALEGAGRSAVLRGEVQAEQALVAGARSRWITGTLEIRAGQFLDLDAGGLFDAPTTPAGGRADVEFPESRIEFLAEHADDRAGMAAAMPWLADAPWRAVTTDLGNQAWVQALPGPTSGALRFVTRLSGAGAILAPPRDPCCLGRGNSIEVLFDPDPAYASYRVERRAGPDAPFAEAARIAAPPYLDSAAAPGIRWGYRITGITPAGDEGIPALVQGTTASAGVIAGSLTVDLAPNARPRVDLVRGSVVQDGGDLVLVGNGYATDGRGRTVRRLPSRSRARSPWEAFEPGTAPRSPREAASMVVALLGGGVARVRATPEEGQRMRVAWEAWPDGDALPPAPSVEAVQGPDGVRVRVTDAPPGWECRSATATPLLPAGAPREIALAEGTGVDAGGAAERAVRYEVRGIDARGRRGPAGAAEAFRAPEGLTRGEFRFHYKQGFSFDREAVVPEDEADVVFETCAGGISSITLAAPGGIANLESVLGRRGREGPDAGAIFDALLRADPGLFALGPKAQADSREPASDVFVLRTRAGGWVKLAILERGRASGGWQENPAYCSYAYNPRDPVFESGAAQDGTPGIVLGDLGADAMSSRDRARDAAILGDAAESPEARALLTRLREQRIRIRVADVNLARFAEAMGGMEIPVEFGEGVDTSRRVEVEEETVSMERVFEVAALSVGLRWRITAAGRVRFEVKSAKPSGR